MRKIAASIAGLFLILFISANAYADCRGCCAGHGGLICENGVTRCVDGTALSQNCLNKSCNVCPEPEATTGLGTIKIASFNIQIFGRSKADKAEVLEVLAEIISQFDIVAIQEIRDKSETAIKRLEVAVDNMGTNYDFIIGPRLGRTSSKEQYAFFYKTAFIQVEGSYTYNEEGVDIFHREPYIAKFKAKNGNFDFVIINIHTDPDEATSEINALPLVITDAQSHFPEPDVILLGDFNADCSYFDENDVTSPLRQSGYTWRITNDMDTTVAASSCTYDRIITTLTLNEDYAGPSGVFRFDQQLELDCEPKEVSDHYPVFSEFKVNSDTD